MASMQLNLKDELRERLAARAAENGFASVEAYIESLLRADVGEDQLVDDDVEQLLLQRLDSDAVINLTPEFIDEFRQQVEQRRRKSRNGNHS
jgi:hypothetical protein